LRGVAVRAAIASHGCRAARPGEDAAVGAATQVPGLETADGTFIVTEAKPGAGPWRLVIGAGQPAIDLAITR